MGGVLLTLASCIGDTHMLTILAYINDCSPKVLVIIIIINTMLPLQTHEITLIINLYYRSITNILPLQIMVHSKIMEHLLKYIQQIHHSLKHILVSEWILIVIQGTCDQNPSSYQQHGYHKTIDSCVIRGHP